MENRNNWSVALLNISSLNHTAGQPTSWHASQKKSLKNTLEQKHAPKARKFEASPL